MSECCLKAIQVILDVTTPLLSTVLGSVSKPRPTSDSVGTVAGSKTRQADSSDSGDLNVRDQKINTDPVNLVVSVTFI